VKKKEPQPAYEFPAFYSIQRYVPRKATHTSLSCIHIKNIANSWVLWSVYVYIFFPIIQCVRLFISISATNTSNICNFRLLFLVYSSFSFAMSTVFQTFISSHLVETGYGKKFEKIDYLLHSSVTYACNGVVELAMASTSYKEHERFPYLRTHDCNDIIECMKLIVIHSQLWSISSISFSQYVANKMDTRVSSKHLISLEVNLVTVFPVKNTEVRSWTASPPDEVLQGRNLEKFVRNFYL
jgi:hypothetical protein